MITVSLYRAFRVIVAMTIVMLVTAAIALVQMVGKFHLSSHQIVIPWSNVVEASGFFGILTASIVAGTLSRERSYLAMAWTRPGNRVAAALMAIAVDFAVIVLIDAFALLIIVASMQIVGVAQYLVLQSDTLESAVLIAGVAFMWYGIIAACVSPFARTGFVYASYPVFFILLLLDASHITRVIGLEWLVHAVNIVNPLAYLNSNHQLAARGYGPPIPSVMGFAIAGALIAAYGWSRHEATR